MYLYVSIISGSNTLPIINFSGQLIQTKEPVRDSMKNIQKRLLGVPRSTTDQQTLTSREEREAKRQAIDNAETHRRIQEMDIMEPHATSLKLERAPITCSKSNSLFSIGTSISNGSSNYSQKECIPKDDCGPDYDYTQRKVSRLPALGTGKKDEAPSNVKKTEQTRNVKLPQVVEEF